MTRERPGARPGPSSSPDHPSPEHRRRTEGRVLELLVWHPDIAVGLVDRIDPDLFADPIHRELVGQVLDVYRRDDVKLGSGTVLELVDRQLVVEAFGLDRPDGTADVWGPLAVADLTELDRATAIRRRLVETVDQLDAGHPPNRLADRLRRLAEQLERAS